MIQVDDKNKVTITVGEKGIEYEAARISMLMLELTKKLKEKDNKTAMAFLRVVHSMANGLAKPIIEEMDKEADEHLSEKMKAKKAEKQRRKALAKEKEEINNGNRKQSGTASGNAAKSGEFNSDGCDNYTDGPNTDADEA